MKVYSYRSLIALVAVLLSVGLAIAATPRRGFQYGDHEIGNSNLDKIDATSPKAPNIGLQVRFCGDNANTSTTYLGPDLAGFWGRALVSLQGAAGCNSLDSTTETTADFPLNASYPAFYVTGMRCSVSSDPGADVVFTLRSAAADTSPVVSCTVALAGTGQDCFAVISNPPLIASGATVAVKVVTGEDLSAQDASCDITIQVAG